MVKVLVVDDILVNRLLLHEILVSLGVCCVEAKNGKEAIDIIKEGSIDIVLMDIEMPIMNGLEATRHIRNKLSSPLRHTPVIAITAHNPTHFFDDYHDVGFNKLITKPYSVAKIKGLIDDVVNGN